MEMSSNRNRFRTSLCILLMSDMYSSLPLPTSQTRPFPTPHYSNVARSSGSMEVRKTPQRTLGLTVGNSGLRRCRSGSAVRVTVLRLGGIRTDPHDGSPTSVRANSEVCGPVPNRARRPHP
jgi:hypothetical protein